MTTTDTPPPNPVGPERPRRAAPRELLTRPWWERHWPGVVAFGIVFAACAFCFAQQRPDLIVRNTTPAGGDVGAHVWWPAFVRDHLLPWRVAGWTMDWWAGFPVGQFYFPLPALLVDLASLVLPYNVALKLVLAAGPTLLPLGAYVCLRGLRLPRPGPELAAVAAVFMVFFAGDPRPEFSQTVLYNQRIAGGTLASTLAGEFAFEIALVFALCFIGTFASALDRRANLAAPALLFAATITSHAVVGVYVLVAAVLVVLFRIDGRRRLFLASAAVLAVGGALSAFWSLPFLATIGYTTSIGYEKITHNLVGDWLLPPYLRWGQLLVVVALVAGAVRRRRATAVMALLTLVTGVLFWAWPEGHVWNLRFLPFWYLGLFLLAGVGVAELCRLLGWFVAAWCPPPARPHDERAEHTERDEGAPVPWLASHLPMILPIVAAVMCATVALVGVNRDLHRPATKGRAANYLPFWAAYNMSGYEETKGTTRKQYAEYRAVIDTVNSLPSPGRVVYEKAREGSTEVQSVYGTDFSLYLLPYWTHGRFPTIEGLYFEASATTPYYFLMSARISRDPSGLVRGLPYRSTSEFGQGVRQMQLMGVKWFMATTPVVKQLARGAPGLRYTKSVPDVTAGPPAGWDIYEVLGAQVVAPLPYEPVVVAPKAERSSQCFGTPKPSAGARDPVLDAWLCAAGPWWEDAAQLDRPIVAAGPRDWVRSSAEGARDVPKRPLPPVTVSDVVLGDDGVRFRVSRTGVPVIVNVSYFPNWEVEGAKGPFRASPNFMVVIPTSRDVRLVYGRTGAEWLGGLATLFGLAGAVALTRWRWPPGGRAPVDPGDGLEGLLAAPATSGDAPPPAPAEPDADYIPPGPESGA